MNRKHLAVAEQSAVRRGTKTYCGASVEPVNMIGWDCVFQFPDRPDEVCPECWRKFKPAVDA